jgi:hypothetical protein
MWLLCCSVSIERGRAYLPGEMLKGKDGIQDESIHFLAKAVRECLDLQGVGGGVNGTLSHPQLFN